jgi:hypothetical protein
VYDSIAMNETETIRNGRNRIISYVVRGCNAKIDFFSLTKKCERTPETYKGIQQLSTTQCTIQVSIMLGFRRLPVIVFPHWVVAS